MRTEATLQEWSDLYAVATRIKEGKPWEKFWDMDIIGIQNGEKEDTVFYSILGRGGDCFGIAVYEGYEAYNDYLMMTMREALNLTVDYVIFSQNNLTCYWGDREELSDKQRKTIRDLGYKYRGRNQWLYFMSYKEGYFPFNLDQDEVKRMTEHLINLELALQHYDEKGMQIDFEHGNMYSAVFREDEKAWRFGEEPLPFTAFGFGNLIITDEDLLSDLAKAPKNTHILEADISYLGVRVDDKKYDRPANPRLCLLVDAAAGLILSYDMLEPDEDGIAALAERIIGFIFKFGAPKEIRVSNILVEAGLEQICDVCKIKLRRVKRLKGIQGVRAGMEGFL